MTKTFRYIGAAAIAAALLGGAAIVVNAQQPGPLGSEARMHGRGTGGHGGAGRGLQMHLRGLDLTDTQRTQVEGIMDANKAAFEEVGRRMGAARQELRKAIGASPVDEAAIRAASAGVAAVEADAAVLRAQVRTQIFGLLSAEQLQKATELEARREARSKERQERGHERRDQRRQGPPDTRR